MKLFALLCMATVASVAADGACDNDADRALIAGPDWSDEVRSCGTSALGNGPATATCLENDLGVSDACADCVGDTTQCGADNCFAQCFADSTSAACLDCQSENCRADLITCTGLTDEELPTGAVVVVVVDAVAGDACDNDADRALIAGADWTDEVTSCATSALGNGPATATCLESDPGVSADCATCFGDTSACGASNCFAQCFADSSSSACLDCESENCRADLIACTGLTDEELPTGEVIVVFDAAAGDACDNDADRALIAGADWTSDVTSCATSSLGNGAATATCLESDPGVSDACADCFGDTTQCGADNCFAQCFADSTSSSCLDCQSENCRADLITCTGLTDEELPTGAAVSGGACQSDADRALIIDDPNWTAEVTSCATSSLGNGAATATCLESDPGVSDACADCFGDTTQCGADNCFAQCFADSGSAACLDCQSENCRADLITCTGLTDEELPSGSTADLGVTDDADSGSSTDMLYGGLIGAGVGVVTTITLIAAALFVREKNKIRRQSAAMPLEEGGSTPFP